MSEDNQEIIDKLEAIEYELVELKEKIKNVKIAILALAFGMFCCAFLVGVGMPIKYAAWFGVGAAAISEIYDMRKRKVR